MTTLTKWWIALSQREQVMLAALGGLLMVLVLTYGVFIPLTNWHHSTKTTLASAEADAYLIAEAVREAGQLAAAAAERPGIRDVPLRQALGETTNVKGIAISRIQPDPSGGLTVWIDTVSPPVFFTWLEELYRGYGIQATRVSLQRDDTSDTVRAQLLLTGREQ